MVQSREQEKQDECSPVNDDRGHAAGASYPVGLNDQQHQPGGAEKRPEGMCRRVQPLFGPGITFSIHGCPDR